MTIIERGKITIKQALIDFFKGMLNYLGVTTRRGFGWGTLIGLLCLIPIILIFDVFNDYSKYTTFALIGLLVIMCFYFLACLATYFRRMRDIGFKARTVLIITLLQRLLLFVPIVNFLAALSIFAMPWIALLVPSGQFKTNSDNKFLQFMMVQKGALK